MEGEELEQREIKWNSHKRCARWINRWVKLFDLHISSAGSLERRLGGKEGGYKRPF